MRIFTFTALAMLLALPAAAEPASRARVDAERTYFVEAGWSHSLQPDPTRWLLGLRPVNGIGLGLGLRHGDWLNTEVRFDVMAGDDAFSHGGQLAAVLDPGWLISPVFGGWVGYRSLRYDWHYQDVCLALCNEAYMYPEHRGTTARTSAMAGVELGVRVWAGPLVVSTIAQYGPAVLSRDQTTWHTTEVEHRPDLDRYGPELNFGVKVGAAF